MQLFLLGLYLQTEINRRRRAIIFPTSGK